MLFQKQAHADLATDLTPIVTSLLRRAQRYSEKTFVGGYFWQPGAMRYDGLHKTTNSSHSPCTLLNFPYFCLEPHRSVKRQRVAEEPSSSRVYPVRSLLQSFYRLELTDRREQKQCVNKLSTEQLNKCLWPAKVRKPAAYGRKDVLTVQQAWCLSIVEGRLTSCKLLEF